MDKRDIEDLGLMSKSSNSIIQLIVAIIGFLFCIFREKIRNCTLLSLVIAHGLYDGMIVLCVAFL